MKKTIVKSIRCVVCIHTPDIIHTPDGDKIACPLELEADGVEILEEGFCPEWQLNPGAPSIEAEDLVADVIEPAEEASETPADEDTPESIRSYTFVDHRLIPTKEDAPGSLKTCVGVATRYNYLVEVSEMGVNAQKAATDAAYNEALAKTKEKIIQEEGQQVVDLSDLFTFAVSLGVNVEPAPGEEDAADAAPGGILLLEAEEDEDDDEEFDEEDDEDAFENLEDDLDDFSDELEEEDEDDLDDEYDDDLDEDI